MSIRRARRQVKELCHEEEKPRDIDHAKQGEGDGLGRCATRVIPTEFPQEKQWHEKGECRRFHREQGKALERIGGREEQEVQGDEHQGRTHAEAPVITDPSSPKQGKIFPERN